jgi:hypothetical protein
MEEEEMRINVDSKLFADKRVERLAALCREPKFSVIGRLLYVWHECYSRKTAELTTEEIDLQAEWIGEVPFGELLTRCLLASRVGEGIFRVMGVEERIAFMKNASECGKASAQARREKYGTARPVSAEGSTKVPSGKPTETRTPPEPLTLSPSPDLDPSQKTLVPAAAETAAADTAQGNLFPVAVAVKKPRKPPSTDTAPVAYLIGKFIDAWRTRYPKTQKPDVGGRTQGLMRTLLTDGCSVTELEVLFQVYMQMNDRRFTEQCHNFVAFRENLTNVRAAFGGGRENPSEEDFVAFLTRKENENGTAALPSAN